MAKDDPAKVMKRVRPSDGFRFLAGVGSSHNHPCIYGHGDKDGYALTVVGRNGTTKTFHLPEEEAEAFAAYHALLREMHYPV